VTRRRLLVPLVATAALLGGLPALAAPGSGEQRALVLLGAAADAARSRSYTGTQYVGTWRGPVQTSAVLDVVHRPGSGSTVTSSGAEHGGDGRGVLLATPELDARLLRLLAESYDLAVVGDGRCAGRRADVVEARRPDRTGTGSVAGRFWLDHDTGLVLRREVYDEHGQRLRSSAFVDLQVERQVAEVPVGVLPPRASGRRVALEEVSWRPPQTLPGHLELFDARMRRHGDADVLHLAYSDGLSTLSVFAQRGGVHDRPGEGFHAERVQGSQVWVQPAAPERVVWQGHGRVFTLVSDASPGTVRAAVAALPHDRAPRGGLLARLGRGLSRLGSWLNPF
jgi:hypothetical protein